MTPETPTPFTLAQAMAAWFALGEVTTQGFSKWRNRTEGSWEEWEALLMAERKLEALALSMNEEASRK
jgi:hypothetical protein